MVLTVAEISGRIAFPAHDREADAQLVEAEDGHEDDDRDREGTELVG